MTRKVFCLRLSKRISNPNIKRMKISPEEAERLRYGSDPSPYGNPMFGYVDESGDLGINPRSSEVLTTSGVFTDRPMDLIDIESWYPKNSRHVPDANDELKFSTSEAEITESYLDDLIRTGAKIYIVSTMKGPGKTRNGKGLLLSNLEEVVRSAYLDHDGPLILIFDRHTAFNQEDAYRMCNDIDESIQCLKHDGDSTLIPELAAPDMVSGGFRYHTRTDIDKNERERFRKILDKRSKMIER